MPITLKNIQPEGVLEPVLGAGIARSDEFFGAASFLFADMKIDLDGHAIEIPEVSLWSLAYRLSGALFSLNFHGENYNDINVGPNYASLRLTVDEENLDNLNVQFQPQTSTVIMKYNGKPAEFGKTYEFPVHLLTLNRAWGEFYKQLIDITAEKFGDIDGVKEYFSMIPFSEGFETPDDFD